MKSTKKLILIGAPGSGKGTFSEFFCKTTQVTHISTGDIIREHIKNEDALGIQVKKIVEEGKLVPDSLVNEIIQHRLTQSDVKNSYLLDGYPRSVEQLQTFLIEHDIDGIIHFEVPNDIILQRLSLRRVCPHCGASFHPTFKPASIEGICDVCQTELIHRKDDTPTVINERLHEYETLTLPIINFAKEKKIPVIDLDGTYNIKTESEKIINTVIQWVESL